jgi:hypothetical protein
MTAGMDPWLAGALQEYFTTLRTEALQASGDVLRVTHRRPRSADSFAHEVLLPAVRRHIAPPAVNGTSAGKDPIADRRQHA